MEFTTALKKINLIESLNYRKIKHYLITVTLLLFSISVVNVYASNQLALVGNWEQYSTGKVASYTYFSIEENLSGVYATVRGENQPDIEIFNTSQVKILGDDLIEISFENKDKKEFRAKLILSAYKSNNVYDFGLATGMLYMYTGKDNNWKLFNTIEHRLVRINKKSHENFIKQVSLLHKKIRKM